MNYGLVTKYLGFFSIAIALLMLPAIPFALYFKESVALLAILFSMLAGVILGMILLILGRNAKPTLFQREALALVTLSWFVASLIGSLPFIFMDILGPVDAFFEAMSGFTTTGATVIQDIEAVPKSILFWRSFTEWLGGVGIVVLFIAVLPYLGAGGKQLFKSESSGPDPRGLRPRIKDAASMLYRIYLGFTVAIVAALMVAGMNFYDALLHTLTTVSSGGFSPKQASIGHYDNIAFEAIIIVGMIAAGTSFALFFQMYRKDWKAVFRDAEWRIYILLLFIAFILVTVSVWRGIEGQTLGESMRASAFTVVSVTTGTGFVTQDFNQWPSFTHVLFLALMFIGGCAGSTTGGIKVVRLIMLAKIAYWRVENTFRPKTVRAVRVGSNVIDDTTRKSVHAFFVLYMGCFFLGMVFMAALGLPFETALASVAATLNNIGPGLDQVGATKDYSAIPAVGKLFLSLCMAVGRLEVFAVLVLFIPSFWKR